MYDVSQTWQDLIAAEDHYFESKVSINGVDYGQDEVFEISVEQRVFNDEQPTVGGCLSSELTVKLLAPSASIPRMAQVRPYVRVTDGTTYSEYIPQGVFYIDTREVTANNDGLDILTLLCYDAMLKSEADFPNTSITFPAKDYKLVQLIAQKMGLQSSAAAHTGIDARTKALMNNGSGKYNITLPLGFSMREVLSSIAGMYAGNWVMNYDGQLRLVTLVELPVETNYLVDNNYIPITFGGVKILV